MADLAEKVVSEMSDSDAFTTKLTASMKTNGVTSVEVDDLKADTTKVPTNAGTAGGEVGNDMLGGGQKNGGANLIVASLLVVTAAVMIM